MASDRTLASGAKDDLADFVLSFIDDSAKDRSDLEDIWDETENNFLVRPYNDRSLGGNTKYPFSSSIRDFRSDRGRAILKDPETHQEVMTIVSKIMLALFPEDRFMTLKPVGQEDTFKSEVAGKLLDYVFRLPNHYGVFFNWFLSAGIYGKGIMEAYWRYEEQEREARSVRYDMEYGMEESSFSTMVVPIYDDMEYCGIDVRDFYGDPGASRMNKMAGAAKRFRLNAYRARGFADAGLYNHAAVEEAIVAKQEHDHRMMTDREATSMSPAKESWSEFSPMIGYEYFGKVVGKGGQTESKVVTVINGITVRGDAWPRRIPFFDTEFTPRLNSFWGIAPAEIIRHDQDFADIMKMMLADAVVRATHPPYYYSKSGDVDLGKLRNYKVDTPIGMNNPNLDVQQAQYNPPLQNTFTMYSQVKGQMREATGALGVVQGLGLGVDRASATEASNTFQAALDRPEMFARMAEREYLPPLAQYTLEVYKNTIDSEELAQRVGESNVGDVAIADIMGEFDIRFVGSRVEGSRQETLSAFREIVGLAANPMVASMVPWPMVISKFFEKLGADDIAAIVANPQLIQGQMALQQQLGPGAGQGNGNGEQPALPAPGMMPAQAGGEVVA